VCAYTLAEPLLALPRWSSAPTWPTRPEAGRVFPF